ncbi:ATPase, T2SS/T4P/T4SS family [Ferviditalea candida]|uniref:ATPase, T2SS/T4P/T4SS family n=1 Tax=Ferviditalea candida TaxID=3108399 RepID=A0ABU5ZI35_9BACL|nr:ATPase, T2SS/T4P/T4SS family [Paenibacillaceae bacterium T2]
MLAYSEKYRENRVDGHRKQDKAQPGQESTGVSNERFQELIEDVRGFLMETRAKTEAEKLAHNEMINRSVLGYAEERKKVLAVISDYLMKKRRQHVPPPKQYETLAEAVFAEVIGMSVLEPILKEHEGLEEIQVVGEQIFEVRGGKSKASRYRFDSLKDVERIQQNLVLFNKDTLTPRKRWAEVMLNDGSRVTLTGFGYTSEPTITIRFYTVRHFTLKGLCEPRYSTIDDSIRSILQCLVRACFNIVVIGPTNSGKTHFIKALISEMPDDERIVTIESRHELMLRRDFPGKNIIEYEIDDEDELHSGRQAFKLALRQSPKRICHAEIRDADANIYVRACTRGHDGSITSVHVSQLEDAPDAIADMCMQDGRRVDPGRLRKRITEYVTQIGIEMAVVEDRRKIVRLGEFVYRQEEVTVRDIVLYDRLSRQWVFPSPFTAKSSSRIRRFDESGFRRLEEMGMVEKE